MCNVFVKDFSRVGIQEIDEVVSDAVSTSNVADLDILLQKHSTKSLRHVTETCLEF